MTEHITVSRELLRQVLEGIKRSRSTAMIQTLVARIPESGLFGGIAQDLDFAESKLRAALEQPPQKPKLRVGQVWRTRGGAVVEVVSETENSPRPFVCEIRSQAGYKFTVTKNGTVYESAQHHSDLIELISDAQEGGEA